MIPAKSPSLQIKQSSSNDGPGASRLEKAQDATRLLCLLAIFAFASFALVDPYLEDASIFSMYCTRAALILVSVFIFWLSKKPA